MALKGHAENLKEELNYSLKEYNGANLAYRENRYQVLDLK